MFLLRIWPLRKPSPGCGNPGHACARFQRRRAGWRLAFTLDGLHRDPTDLADRIDEIATGLPNAQRKPT
jgi:hypothetical protein